MDNLEIGGSKSSPKKIFVDLENDEDVIFKPLTKGLGFHHEEKKLARTSRSKVSSPSSESVDYSAIFKNKEQERSQVVKRFSHPKVETPKELPTVQLDNSIFEKKESVVQKKSIKEPAKVDLAKKHVRLTAWLVDLVVISCLLTGLFTLFVILSGLKISSLLSIISGVELILFGSIFFVIFYSSYFTLFDLGQTIGKKLLGIKLETDSGQVLEVKHTFTRSILVLFGLIGFVPNLFDFQDKLSDTRIVKK